VHRSPLGFWVLTRHADVLAVLRDPRMSRDPRRSERMELLRSSAEVDELLSSEEAAPSMLFVDPPDHTRLRALVTKAFTPGAVERLRPRIEAIVAELLDRVEDAGEMDVVEDLAYPLPVTVICELFGVPERDRDRFRAWSQGCADLTDRAASAGALIDTATAFLGSTLYSLRTLRIAPTISWSLGKMCSAAWEKSPTVGQLAFTSRGLAPAAILPGSSRAAGRTSFSFHQIVSVMNGITGCMSRSAPSSTAATTLAVWPARAGSFIAGFTASTYQSQKSRQKKS
jgi:hypothetical protein